MSEIEELETAQSFLTSGQKEKALPLLWRLYASKNLEIRLDAGLSLLVALDHLTENENLLEVTNKTIEVASALGRNDVRAYLLSKKAELLFNKLANLTYRQRSLNLAAGVFQWIEFSLEEDKAEFAEIAAERVKLEKEISSLEAGALAAIQSTGSHYMRGNIFLSLGEISFSRFLHDQLHLMRGGKLKSKIMHIYFVRRWHFDKFIGYDGSARRKLRESQKKSVDFVKRAIEEFGRGNYTPDRAHPLYSLAVKFTLTFRFSKAKKYLNQSRRLAEMTDEKALLVSIGELEKRIKDKYRHPRNYVEEFGLDLPRGLRN
jgi:hypothetical protein